MSSDELSYLAWEALSLWLGLSDTGGQGENKIEVNTKGNSGLSGKTE